MDDRRFDDMVMALAGEPGTRRSVLRVLASGIAGGALAGLLDSESAGSKNNNKNKNKKKKNKPKNPPPTAECVLNEDCGGCQSCIGGQCEDDPVRLCDSQRCLVPRCTGQSYTCVSECFEGDEECCNGRCEPACTNGCAADPNQACLCETPPAGTRYCPASNTCGECCDDDDCQGGGSNRLCCLASSQCRDNDGNGCLLNPDDCLQTRPGPGTKFCPDTGICAGCCEDGDCHNSMVCDGFACVCREGWGPCGIGLCCPPDMCCGGGNSGCVPCNP